MILANSCSQLPSFAPHVTQGPGKPQTLRALALLLPFVWQEHPRACSSRLESLPIQRKLKLLHVEKESHSKREGQHSTLIPRLLLAGIIPIASALGADALGWDQQLFHSWESFNLCQS